MTSNNEILFIQTGGTIDKDYPRSKGGYAFEFGEPAVQRLLERLAPSFRYRVVTAFQKDSLEVNDEDREALAELIEKSPHGEYEWYFVKSQNNSKLY
jgi:L-asparaginase